jgi:hypothetical protein
MNGVLDPPDLRQWPERKLIHAAPTELGGLCGTCGYSHGAPNGAFRIAAPAVRVPGPAGPRPNWSGPGQNGLEGVRATLAIQIRAGERLLWQARKGLRMARQGCIKLLRSERQAWVPISLSETNPAGLAAGSRWSATGKGPTTG